MLLADLKGGLLMRPITTIDADITKAKDKIAELNSRLKKLSQERTETENAEIIGAIRSGKMSDREYLAIVKRFRQDTPKKEEEPKI